MAYLPPGANHGRRLQTLPRGAVIVNCVLDKREVGRNIDRLKTPSRAKDAFHQGLPAGEYAGSVTRIFDAEPLMIARPAAYYGTNGRFTSGKTERNMGSVEVRIPVISTSNGAMGKSASEVDDRYAFLAISHEVNRAHKDNWATGLVGGLVTITNPLEKTIPTGAYVRVRTATKQEALKLKYADGDRANGQGRIPWVYDLYDPKTTDYYDHRRIRQYLQENYEITNTDADRAAYRATRKEEKETDHLKIYYGKAIDALVDALTDYDVVFGANAMTDALDDATVDNRRGASRVKALLFLYYSGSSFHTDAYKDTLFRATNYDITAGSTAARLLENNPVQQFIRGCATLKMRVEDQVIGRQVIGMQPGCDGDIHLRPYAH